ncbi:MAG: cryptochrome/photolyase family protein [Pseudomonadota bacterium]
MTTLRLILGDQLNPLHSWFDAVVPDVVYLMMEIRQETDYVLHHAQKILAIFAAMRDFAARLEKTGHRVHYLAIDDPANRHALPANLDWLLAHYDASSFKYQEPDEWRLDVQLAAYAAQQTIASGMVESEHFYTSRREAGEFFKGKQKWLMENFYRGMRKRHNVLMDGAKPAGGAWNYDADNRGAWPGSPAEPADRRPVHDHSALWATIVGAGVASFGQPHANALRWPLNRAEALQQLDAFIEHALPRFGDFQDAMNTHASRLFHSLLSFAMNTKMLNPAEVVARAEKAWGEQRAPLSAVEGFIRQILGWREFIRGVYWARMPDYAQRNVFDHQTPLPEWFWSGQTKMRCLAHAIGDSLENAHAHHIQRLMIIGNFALLAGLQPTAVHQWYLGIYIDAFEWVEMPNTLGMSQFADGGMLATKPYVSSAAYIDRMSNYCKGCHYDRKAREGERACPFNALYWDFFARNAGQLASNPRLGMVYRHLEKMAGTQLDALQTKANVLRSDLDAL